MAKNATYYYFRIREFTIGIHKSPCVLGKSPNFLCFSVTGKFCVSFSVFSLTSGDPCSAKSNCIKRLKDACRFCVNHILYWVQCNIFFLKIFFYTD